MQTLLPGIIMSFREGLEAFLIIAIILRYIDKTEQNKFKRYVGYGVSAGVILSIGMGFVLYHLSLVLQNGAYVSKLWESAASIGALALVTTFIYWMIKHGRHMTEHIEKQVDLNFSKMGLMLVSFIMVAREGAEIAIFSFSGKYPVEAIGIGLFASLVISTLIFLSLIRVNLKTIFNITLVYLILQAGFLLGYGIHEGLSALKDLGHIAKDNVVLAKVFDLSHTALNHKEGIIGVPLYVLFGWYSKPEWIQFAAQHIYSLSFLILWWKGFSSSKGKKPNSARKIHLKQANLQRA